MLCDGGMDELNIIFPKVKPNRQAGTLVMKRMALVARMKLSSDMAAPGIEPSTEGRRPGCQLLSYSPGSIVLCDVAALLCVILVTNT